MLDEALTAFLHEGLGIHVGTRNERFEPNGARGVALRVEDDRAHVIVYVSKIAAVRLLPDLEANGQIAISLARPTDDRACQVKGFFHSARAARKTERDYVAAQWDAFMQNLERIGIPRVSMRSWITWPATAIRLRATAVFEQTPKPGTGTRVV